MSKETTPQNPAANLNIEAAKKYISSTEKLLVKEPAKKALNELKEALQTKATQAQLMDLARVVESAQAGDKKDFTAHEFEQHITEPAAKDSEPVPEKNETLPRNATAEYIVEKVYETGNETLIDGAEILL
ncbi:MAG: hypothetical protein WCK88_05015 [bacterium]